MLGRNKLGQFVLGHKLNLGIKFSQEHRDNLSYSHKGLLVGSKNPNWGKPRSKEVKQKISKTKKEQHIITKTVFKKGKDHPFWRGGGERKFITGYWYVYMPNHLRNNGSSSYIKKCILIAEKYLNRNLNPEEIIHHINGIKDDDRPENLYLFPNKSKHQRYEKLKNKLILKSNIV